MAEERKKCGEGFWRSLEESQSDRPRPDEESVSSDAFPHGPGDVSRRHFLRFMGASLALAGLGGCDRPPAETIVPYVRQPEEIVPGKPLFFATAISIAGLATGLLVETHMGRPTKIEGNPSHPASLGATDALAQASVLGLYDPDRSQVLTYLGRIRPWSQFVAAMQELRKELRQNKGKGLRILTGTIGSPSLGHQINQLLKEFPGARWHQWEPAGRHHTRAGARLAFGAYVETQYRLEKAEIVVALDGTLLSCAPGYLRYAREFARRRAPSPGAEGTSRFYAVECTPSSTGATADHRLALSTNETIAFVQALAVRLGIDLPRTPSLPPPQAHWLEALARDLEAHRGSSVVLASEHQPPLVHALAHAINRSLGNVNQTVAYTDPIEVNPTDEIASLKELAADIDAGAVDTLIILEGNPAYTAPADLGFRDRLAKIRLRIHLSLYNDETSALCHWHVPAAHYLESWSDGRAFDGTASIAQPVIAPLYGGKTAHELLATLSDRAERSAYDVVRAYWRERRGGSEAEFERFWRKSLHDGVIEGTAFAPKAVSLNLSAIAAAASPLPSSGSGTQSNVPRSADSQSVELVFRPDPSVLDGSFANNAWLQELPKPLSKLTWDNAALVSPATAERLGLGTRQGFTGGAVYTELVEIRFQGRAVRAPAWILPGQPDGTITVHLGYGRTRAGRVGTGTGFDGYALRTTAAIWSGSGAEVRKLGGRYALATTQTHHNIHGRDLVRTVPLAQDRETQANARPEKHNAASHPSLYPEFAYPGYAWGMAIDLARCIGCNACVIACQAENNIPTVGKDQVLRSREMHWLRIDSYFKGPPNNPETVYQPVPCMHCEMAPCEVVCPVTATAHSAEGLNDMVYNRCVGTRYCSNNCPYKVRRFNFFQFSDWNTPSLKSMRNPDVTVRSRGVMEKCTYCVQRINRAKIEAEKDGRRIRDGEILTACQQACPAEAIVFGDINDAESTVSKLKADARNYALLEELNTRPRTTYLAAVRNPNPAMDKA
ncbi:MAG TPA: 4Fe-4S dicluster domain-containing protein [Candidatus Eisenbacteria bacterium]|nr:4Fe-4S dicluster domain-containing protein [Candidatus Eisenbacteria bacterium]